MTFGASAGIMSESVTHHFISTLNGSIGFLRLSQLYRGVTVGNSPTAPGTLGSYQSINRARPAGLRTHAGVNTTERSHF